MSSIFIVGTDNKLTELDRTDYDSEDLFQRLLVDHPAMLRLASGPEGKMLLVRRELPVPDAQNGSDRWSLDHLFLDRQGVPVLVEVKQASDTRARREVVAQMLDYAANGVAYWPIDRIVQAYRDTATAAGLEPDSHLAAFLDNADAESFWRAVEANLRSGRVRMLFVADRIPKELSRIVEFLNEQMRPAEVLAIEIEQFASATGIRTLVPRLVGQTERAQTVKAVTEPADRLSKDEWLESLERVHGARARAGTERAVNWFRANDYDVVVTNSQDSLAAGILRPGGRLTYIFFMRKTSGRIETSLANLSTIPAYGPNEARGALLNAMRAWPSSTLKASDKLTGWPSVSMEELEQEQLWEAFTALAGDISHAVRSGARL
ncbi:hypothetical protein CN172_01015 [Sinorhizobium meliloti]|uniref:hypothetical protein n=1 Tax=Rhizobium meliloti TaxID=382 RepID=UPI000FDC46EE|nr:hypothetical protein [Sinorhizobium meliloti]RVE99717.1 hypothetical protein CN232_16490 [Sinorhizobium meliloti]RVH42648.1 hypothetical protein CN208_17765 [Sinorhizobium meliloti]RVK21650.1 hypothetical protein CN172_01015 [Sinorhizobium meliloti]